MPLPKFDSPEDLQKQIDAYFARCKEEGEPLTITGLALALDCDRDTLLNYGRKEEYFGTVKRAKLRIHNYAENKLFGDGNKTGVIFNLKNNWNWKDKTEVESHVRTYQDYLEELPDPDDEE